MDINNMNIKKIDPILPQDPPVFDEDGFDLMEHKKAASTTAQARAHIKRARRKVALGRVIIMIAAMAVCGLLWFMVSMIVGML